MVWSAPDPIGLSALLTMATVRAPRERAYARAGRVSAVAPEYEARNTSDRSSSLTGSRQRNSYERLRSAGTRRSRSQRYLPEYMLDHEPPLPTKKSDSSPAPRASA